MMVDLKGYEGLYRINESGIIVNKKGHPMRTALSNAGYLRVSLIDPIRLDPKRKNNESVHRLVAQTFIENPDPEINNVVMHKDNDTLNNHVSNLKWGTQSENIQQAFDENRKYTPNSGGSFYNEFKLINKDTGDCVICHGRADVAQTIQYKEISLKNMVGNERKIAFGPYTGYYIYRGRKINKAIYFIDPNDPHKRIYPDPWVINCK